MAVGSRGGPGWAAWLEANQSIIFPVVLLGSLAIFIAPLPSWAMDVLLSANIALSVMILAATLTMKSPLEFTVFPTLLLATTMFRLVLNVATTRLVLVNAPEQGSQAAGHVVEAFGNFVAQGNIILGIVIFMILMIIQFQVITKGATRISEVAARFSLDGMPGKQMAVDADLNAGVIDDREAKRRRDEITKQAEFYGAMDGASKFVRGDNVAGLFITAINIVGGLAIGSLYYNMPVAEAARVFSVLTIGDGLVSQIPAILLSLASGFLVTRQSSESNVSKMLGTQIFTSSPQTLFVGGGFLSFMALSAPITGLPFFPLAAIAIACFYGGYALKQATEKKTVRAAEAQARAEQTKPAERPQDRIEDVLKLDSLELEVGYALIPLADKRKGGDLEERIVLIRRQLANELGMILPGVRLRDNPNLAPNDYQVKLKGNVIAQGSAYPGHYLAIDTGMTSGRLQGIKTTDPLFQQTAYWIDPHQRERADILGYTVIEAAHVVTTHLTDTIKKFANELLNRERVASLIDVVKERSPKVVGEVIPDIMKLGEVQRVLQNLLREGVSIRDMETILETLGDYATKTKDPDILTEYVRHRLSRAICQQFRDRENVLKVVTLDPSLEDMIAAGIEHTDRTAVKLSTTVMEGIGRAINEEVRKLVDQSRTPIVLVGPQIRAALKQMTSQMIPNLIVLSYNEITRDTKVEAVGMATYMPNARPAVGAMQQ